MIYTRLIKGNEHDFLLDMFYESIYIPKGKPSKQDLLSEHHIKKYYKGWGRPGDRALIVLNEQNLPIGAAWYRLFTETEQGFGFVDENTPELGIAVIPEDRGKEVGKLLMEKLKEQALFDGYSNLSLSVDPNNSKAVTLYHKLGFSKHGVSGTSWTMIWNIAPK